MDLATIVGLILGVALLLAAVGSQVNLFVDMPSMFIVIGGAVAGAEVASRFSWPPTRISARTTNVKRPPTFSTIDSRW